MELSKDLTKAISKVSYYDVDAFISDAKDYISAVKEGRMLCVVVSVSNSGMSRTLKFNSCEKGKNNNFWYRQYNGLFEALGYKPTKNRDGFRVNGCGMDMVFYTNYSIIHQLMREGFITKNECEVLAQLTPTVL